MSYQSILRNRRKRINKALAQLHLKNKPIENEVKWVKPYSFDDGEVQHIMSTRVRGEYISVMPVTATTCSYRITDVVQRTFSDEWIGNCTGYELRGEVKLHPIGKLILDRGGKVGNYRAFGIGINKLKANELYRQMKRCHALAGYVSEIQKEFALPFRTLLFDLEFEAVSESINKWHEDNWDNIKEAFLKDFVAKKNSKIISGTPYDLFIVREQNGDILLEPTYEILFKIRGIFRSRAIKLRAWMILHKARILLGDEIPVWIVKGVMFGLRQRTGNVDFNERTVSYEVVERKYRDRWVIGIFLLAHIFVGWTEDEVDAFDVALMKRLNKLITFKFTSPIEGNGETWNILVKMVSVMKGYIADGTGWETQVGNWLSPIGCIFLGFITLASGVSFTTICGIIGIALYLEWAIQKGLLVIDYACGFGDNVIMFGQKIGDVQYILTGDEDTNDLQIYLGVSLIDKIVHAFKVCRDSANKRLNSTLQDILNYPRYDKVDTQRRLTTYVVYGFTKIANAVDLMSGSLTGNVYKGGGLFDWFSDQMALDNKVQDELKLEDTKILDEGKYWDEKYVTRIN